MKLILFLFLVHSVNFLYAQKIELNTPYINRGGADQQLDLYVPATKNFRTIIYVHEGGLLSGDKKDEPYARIAQKFQSDGIAVALINYRLGPTNKWPSQPDDVCAAFAWIKRTIKTYGGDSSKIFIVGHSSGATLTSLVATDEKYIKKQGYSLRDISGFILIGTQLKAVYPAVAKEKLPEFFQKNTYLKIFGDTSTFKDASAMYHLNKDVPAGLIIIAEKEQVNPPILAHTLEFIDSAKQYHLDINYAVVPDRNHMSNITKMVEEGDPVYKMIKGFVMGH